MVLWLGILLIGVSVSPAVAEATLPNGYEGATWGVTVSDLKKQIEVGRADLTDEFGYAEHLEEDPEVYFRNTPRHERIEYYFYEGRLYKVFIIYDRIYFHTRFYEKLIGETQTTYGKPTESYPEEFFGLTIEHTVWEDSTSILDLRKGAGFIYQVRIDKAAAQKKSRDQTKKKSI